MKLDLKEYVESLEDKNTVNVERAWSFDGTLDEVDNLVSLLHQLVDGLDNFEDAGPSTFVLWKYSKRSKIRIAVESVVYGVRKANEKELKLLADESNEDQRLQLARDLASVARLAADSPEVLRQALEELEVCL